MIRKRYIVAGSMLGDIIRIGVPGTSTRPAHTHEAASTSAVPSRTPAADSAQPSFTAELTARHDGAGWSDYQAAEADLNQAVRELESGTNAAPDTDRITPSADADIALADPTLPAGDADCRGWLSRPGPGGTDVALADCANAAASLDIVNGRFSSRLAATQGAAS
jgi:hypothetical protein